MLGTPAQEAQKRVAGADEVARVVVLEALGAPDGSTRTQRWRVRVVEPIWSTAPAGSELVIDDKGGSACPTGLEVGEAWLVFLRAGVTDGCSGSRPVDAFSARRLQSRPQAHPDDLRRNATEWLVVTRQAVKARHAPQGKPPIDLE